MIFKIGDWVRLKKDYRCPSCGNVELKAFTHCKIVEASTYPSVTIKYDGKKYAFTGRGVREYIEEVNAARTQRPSR